MMRKRKESLEFDPMLPRVWQLRIIELTVGAIMVTAAIKGYASEAAKSGESFDGFLTDLLSEELVPTTVIQETSVETPSPTTTVMVPESVTEANIPK